MRRGWPLAKFGGSVFALVTLVLGCASQDPRARLKTVSVGQYQAELVERGIWSGGAEYKFEDVGRGTLATAIELGLMPEHKVLDIGAGSLRVGWWFLHFIEPSNYYAIEPVRERIHTAIEILGVDDIHVFYNMDFKFPPVDFDFVIARSIWTHASKDMITTMLAEFAENSTPDAKFLTSVKLAETPDQEYWGTEWVGRINADDQPAVVFHSSDWMEREAAKYGLKVEVLGDLTNQTWVVVSRDQEVE